MAGQKDWDIARHAQENDFVFVTNNAADFRALYATQELHPGLVILIPNVRADLQRRLFTVSYLRVDLFALRITSRICNQHTLTSNTSKGLLRTRR
jgi:hypothetical protein